MFQYAFYLSLKKEHPLSIFLFDIEKSMCCHAGYQLDQVFSIDTYRQQKNYRRLRKYFPYIIEKSTTITQDESLRYDEKFLNGNGLFTIYQGFWQSEKFFFENTNVIRTKFSFNKEKANTKTRKLSNSLLRGNETYISIHIRRGDYLQEPQRGICTTAYYKDAIQLLQKKEPKPIFIFFSDDIKWTKKEISIDNSIYVDWNHDSDNWQDMYLMSLCKHNIIANSSFSWWGAWLNTHHEKMVIAPKQWFHNRDNNDILPDKWITI
jgi:hypothetical protein